MVAVLAIAAAAAGPVRGQTASNPLVYDFEAAAAAGENPANKGGSAANGQAFYGWESAEKPDSKRQDYKGYEWDNGSVLPTVCHVWRRSDLIRDNIKNGGLFFPTSRSLAIDGLTAGTRVVIVYDTTNTEGSQKQMVWAIGDGSFDGVQVRATATVGGVEAVTGVTAIPSGVSIRVSKVTPAENGSGYIVLDVKKGTVIKKIIIGGEDRTVRIAEGTNDSAHWAVRPAVALTTGVAAGTTVSAAYSGTRMVKKVKGRRVLKPIEIPLTLEALTDGTIKVKNPNDGMQYSLNGGARTPMSVTTEIDVAKGDKVAFYGNGTNITCYQNARISGGTAEVKAYGNIMSLVDEFGYDTATTLTANLAFFNLFYNNDKLTDASGLLLPAMTLSQNCYYSLFNFCANLTSAPALPATTLAEGCYQNMFHNCTALTTAPALPATTLAEKCYYSMFHGCTSLTKTPSLPATTLAKDCYVQMFRGCTSLTTAPDTLLATTLFASCYLGMFNGCTGLTKAPVLPATTLTEGCYCKMFSGCTHLTAAPALPATTLTQSCYSEMFKGCTSLTTAPALPATTLARYGYFGMFSGCTSLTTAPDTLPATTLATNCYGSMFEGCTSLTTAPVLPAATLAESCYQNMFSNCSKLDSVTCLATAGINTNNSTTSWLAHAGDSVQGIKLFIAEEYATWPTNVSGVPEGWTLVRKLKPMKQTPLTLEATTAGTILVYIPQSGMQYTLNGGAKTAMNSNPCVINVSAGDKVAFYGNGTSITSYNTTQIRGGTAEVKVYGNIMSLVNENGFDTTTTLTGALVFDGLFKNNDKLTDASGLLLPATTLSNYCYQEMFYRCTALTKAPATLPATVLTSNCYKQMFDGCSSLTTVPVLPATTLAESCYSYMFSACRSLITVPSDMLPATTLAQRCYASMFYGCSGLTTAPTLPATTLAEICYNSMFYGCTSLTTAPALPATTLAVQCYVSMFSGCSGLTATPALPATTLAQSCYYDMFKACTSLTAVPDTLPATTLATNCYNSMFYGCTSLTTAPVLPATTLVDRCYQTMFYDCSKLDSVTCLATAGINTDNSTYHWLVKAGDSVQGAKIFTAVEEATWPTHNNGVPAGWTLVNKKPTKDTPLTLKALTDGTIVVSSPKSGMQYSINGGAKTAVNGTINVSAGDRVAFYGNGTNIISYISTRIAGGTAEVKVYGNIMSLVNENGFDTATTLTANYVFNSLFQNNDKLTDASGLLLPATTLSNYCYQQMFSGCTSLTTVPALPATTLTERCYNNMFSDCTGLTTAPALPATTLARGCYDDMFHGCTALTTVPDTLPATTLTPECYNSMFYDCTSLTTAPVLLATTLATSCCSEMFRGCSSLATAPVLPATTLAQNCYYGMFQGCTGLTTAPDTLPATTLARGCYIGMFKGCTSLTAAPVLPATTLTPSCYQQMFNGCTKLSSVTCLATAGINTSNSTSNWLANAGDSVQSTKLFIAAEEATWPTSNNGVPAGWTIVRNGEKQIPLTLEATTAGTIEVSNPQSGMQYSVNGGAKMAVSGTINVSAGDKVSFFGNGTSITGYNGTTRIFGGTAEVKVYGNIMSLVNENGFDTATTLTANNAFLSLFNNNDKLTDASGLVLPATTLTVNCYNSMFYNCIGLTKAPDTLPATTLAVSCYGGMFNGCTSLTTAPALPATTMAERCYDGMFKGCIALTTASDTLPATTLASYCYRSMFFGCTSLTTAPVLPATTLVDRCYQAMFYDCSKLDSVTCLATTGINTSNSTHDWLVKAGDSVQSTKLFIAAEEATWPTGNNGIPDGWTIERKGKKQIPLTLEAITDGTIKIRCYRRRQGGLLRPWHRHHQLYRRPDPRRHCRGEGLRQHYESRERERLRHRHDADGEQCFQ